MNNKNNDWFLHHSYAHVVFANINRGAGMSRSNPAILFGFFVAVIVAMCGSALLKGGLFISAHEGDTYHLLDILLRMTEGQQPHIDFMTPIGAFAFAPIVLFMKFGYGVGTAIVLAQTLVALIFLPAIWWAAFSRMTGVMPYLFGLIVLVLVTALVHGNSQSGISVSMHYNRWSWGTAFVAITLAVLPNEGKARPVADGLVIGLAMSALLMLKITYFAAFLVPIGVAMALRGNFRAIVVAAVSGAGVAVLISFVAGIGFWPAYLADLLTVLASDIRPNPGEDIGAVVGAPAYLAGSLALLMGVVLLRQAGEGVAGLVLLLLVPGFFYVTYQNFGNDPQWLMLLGILLFALQPGEGQRNSFGWDMRNAAHATGIVAFALAAPSFLNLAYSPFKHMKIDVVQYTPLLPNSVQHDDLQGHVYRTIRAKAQVPMDGVGASSSTFAGPGNDETVTVFQGETLPQCELQSGMTRWFQVISDDLESQGFARGKRVFAADVLSSHWLFGSLLPLEQGAPWYYGGLAGFDSADYLLVPICPVLQKVREMVLNDIAATGSELTEIRRTPLFILFSQ